MVLVRIVFGDARSMKEVSDNSVHLIVTSPPYYNAPFDFPGLFKDYSEYLSLLRDVAREIYRVLIPGRVACFVVQDVRIREELYPIVADLIHIMGDAGFKYQERIIWRKPEGYIRISRRSGILLQHPYPMYFYPDNIYEDIIVFRKPGEFNRKSVKEEIRERSRINIYRFQSEKWYLTIWDIKNVLPSEKWSKYTAVFPEELVERLITLYSYYNETVLDPFLGTGTTAVVARRLGRNVIGYEIDLELKEIIEERLNLKMKPLVEGDKIEVIVRDDAKKLRTKIREEVERRLSEKNNSKRRNSKL